MSHVLNCLRYIRFSMLQKIVRCSVQLATAHNPYCSPSPQPLARGTARVALAIFIAAVLPLVWFGFLDLMQEATEAGLGCLRARLLCLLSRNACPQWRALV